jgi:uncharacterized protein
MATVSPFWIRKTLAEMSTAEWESLCDGCAQCCLYKLEDEDTGQIYYTRVVCRFLDLDTCRCKFYSERNTLMPTCILLTPELASTLNWLPKTCTYRLLAEGKDLPSWHPLVSGDAGTVHRAKISVRYRAIPEEMADMDNLDGYAAE